MQEKLSMKRQMPSSSSSASQSAFTEGGYSNSALLDSCGMDSPPDPNLGTIMRQRVADSMGIPAFQPSGGRDLTLPQELKSSVEQHFGHSVDNLRFQESSDVSALGAKAYAQGNVIHFAPGQFRPDTHQGRMMLGHEIAHIEQQARGGFGAGGAVHLDPSLEQAADRHGMAIAAGETASFAPSALSPMPTAPVSAAPVQGWGISILNRGKGQHEILTEEARKKVRLLGSGYDALGDKKARDSLQYGSRFNDVGKHSALGMVAQMELLKKDAFINQTHHGDMQFLHSMDTSGGDTEANVKKARRYARFASDTFQNRDVGTGGKFQNQNMLNYVLSQTGDGDPFQEMMLPTMVDPSALKKFDKKFKKTHGDKLTAADRAERIRELKKLVTVDENAVAADARASYERKGRIGRFFAGSEADYMKKQLKKQQKKAEKNQSSYAKDTIANFFTNGDKDLDAGYVALGSASHMLEDSFAASHSIRADNLYAGGEVNTPLSDDGAELIKKATPIITAADYNQQANNPLWGRHPIGDKFYEDGANGNIDQIIQQTKGGSLARDTAAQYIKMNMDMKSGGIEGTALNTFIDGILRAAPSAKTGETDTSEPAPARENPMNPRNVETTVTGRAFAKDVSFSTKRKQNKSTRNAIGNYRELTRAHIKGNRLTGAEETVANLESEVHELQSIMTGGDEEAKAAFRPHVGEALVNTQNMLEQLQGKEDDDATNLQQRLSVIKGILTGLL